MESRLRKIVYLGTPPLAAAVVISVFLITTSNSGPATSAGVVLPTACNGPATCLSLARQAGFDGRVLMPSGHVVNYQQDYYYQQQGHNSLGVALGYRQIESGRAFSETVFMRPNFVYPCPSTPGDRPVTSSQGRTACLVQADSNTNTLGVRFYSSGIFYQLAPLAGVPHSAQEAFLLALVDNLSWQPSDRADPGPQKWST